MTNHRSMIPDVLYDLFATSGGGAPAHWRSVYAFAQTQPLGDTYTAFAFNTGDDPAPLGDGIGWDIGTPDTVTINRTGRYDLSAKLCVHNSDVADLLLNAEIFVHGDNAGPGYSHDIFGVRIAPGDEYFALFSIPGVPIEAGETLKLIAKCAPGESGQMWEGVLTVSAVA